MDYYNFLIEQDDKDKRLDVYLVDELNEISRSTIQKLIEEGCVTVNSAETVKNRKLKYRDIVEVCIPDAAPVEIKPADIPLDIVFEDDDIIIINKPKNLVMHPAPGHYDDTLVNALMFHTGENLSGINGELRPGIVHRIDKDTSGIVVAAKTNRAHSSLALQFMEHTITRKYHAVVWNNIKPDSGVIDVPIGRNEKDRKKMAVTYKSSRNAITRFKVIERFGKYTYIEAALDTGRTHQIRVHMAHMGNSVLGDMIYGIKKQPYGLDSQVLHAKVLGFKHPVTGVYMEFESELPEYFTELLNKLRSEQS